MTFEDLRPGMLLCINRHGNHYVYLITGPGLFDYKVICGIKSSQPKFSFRYKQLTTMIGEDVWRIA